MRSRYQQILVLLVLVVALSILALTDCRSREPAVMRDRPKGAEPEKLKPCRATFERVASGMTFDQVVATVGAPPGVYIHGELGSDVVTAPRGLGWSDYVGWVVDDGELLVLFVDKMGHPIQPEAVAKDDKSAEVHIWDVLTPGR